MSFCYFLQKKLGKADRKNPVRFLKVLLFYVLDCLFAQGKATSFTSLISLATIKSLWINLKNQIIEYRKLAVGNNRHNNRLFGLFQAGHCMDEGGTTVDLLMDHLVDLLIFRADHHNLSLFLAHNQNLIHNNAGQQYDQNTIEHLLSGGNTVPESVAVRYHQHKS